MSGRQISRREFVATGAAGVFAWSRAAESFARGELRVDDAFLYVGTYTEGTASKGVYVLRMDPRSGSLREVGAVDAGPNPSFLALHPDGRTLYAVNEVDKRNGRPGGSVTALSIASRTGELKRVNEQSSGGPGPCFVSVDRHGGVVLVANYDAGSVAVLPIGANGSVAPAAQVLQHSGRGPNSERQATPHAHCVLTDPSNRFALSADLGADRVFVYRFDGRLLHPLEGSNAIMRPGAGPRHIAFHPKLPLLFVANELDSTIATLHFDAEHGSLSARGVQSTLPAGWTGTNYPADIHVDASGHSVYVSNRGHNSIASFRISNSGALTFEQAISTEGDWPRNFAIDPRGRWLLVANQKSNSIVVVARDPATGHLTPTGQRLQLPSPVCLRFWAPTR
jgi:6-phosphogluconolactonase